MSQKEKAEIDRKILETDLKIRRTVLAILRKLIAFKRPTKTERREYLMLLLIVVGCPTLVYLFLFIANFIHLRG